MKSIDKPFLFITGFLVLFGIIIFISAVLGLLARDGGANISDIFFSQLVLGVLFGGILLFIFQRLNYRFWKRASFYIFIISIFFSMLVFVPSLGLEHGGATRWLLLGPVSLQPSEILKFGFVIYLSAWFSMIREKIFNFKYGIFPFLIFLIIAGAILLSQPDTGTFAVLFISGVAVFFAAGGRVKHLAIIILTGIIGLFILASFKPYVKDRIETFLDPSRDPQGSGFQIKQSLIAIGSGGIFGRGFGQSVQKFNYLPEPIGDSVFAVLAEEFGFIGSIILIILFILFTIRGLQIAARAPDSFARLTTTGLVILIVSQSFLNMAAMLGVMPLTGLPLLFVSHGGTAMLMTLAEVGIILNISRYIN